MKLKMLMMVILLLLAMPVLAEEDDAELFPEGSEELLNTGSAILATVLFALTFLAYKRTKQQRLLFVTLAFLLFAIKGYISGAELIVGDFDWSDIATALLDFAILLSFFAGVLKR